MKASAEKSSSTVSRTTASRPFFAKAGGGNFFAPVNRAAVPAVQAKMTVGKTGDKFEREADKMADKVMRMPSPASSAKEEKIQRKADEKLQKKENEKLQKAPAEEKIQKKDDEKIRKAPAREDKLQRKGNDAAPAVSATTQSAIRSKTSGGQPLSADVRRDMEGRFNADFSKVRIHSNAEAAGLSNQLSARAFTHQNHIFFSRNQYQPGTSEGKQLLAHELTHTIQQGHAVQRSPQVSTTVTPPTVQRLLGIDIPSWQDVLNWLADKAYNIPGYRMFTIVIGSNPINGASADRSAANILRAIVEFLPGGKVITDALQKYGVFEKAGSWIEGKLKRFENLLETVKLAVSKFMKDLDFIDVILHPVRTWEKAVNIFKNPVDQIISFIGGIFQDIFQFIRDAVLMPLAALAQGKPGFDLLCAILGKNPITKEVVPRTPDTLIGGFMKLIGQEEVWGNIKKGNAIQKAWKWFNNSLQELLTIVTQFPDDFIAMLKSLEVMDFIVLPSLFIKVFKVFGNFVVKFTSWGLNTVLSLLEILVSVVRPTVMPYIKKAQASFVTIIKNPVGFVGNLVRAGKLGFEMFAGNILTHLKTALIKWLVGPLAEAGVYIPQSFQLMEIIKLVLSVLGLTWQNIRAKLVKIIPDPVLAGLETTASILVTLVKDGPAAAWEQIKAELTELKDQLIGQVTEMISTEVVKAAVTKLVSMLNPAGAVIQAIIAIYNTVTFFIEKAQQLGAVVASFIDSIAAIAAGQVAPAAKRVEQTLANTLVVVIGFLAKFAGLGNIPTKLVGIVKKVRQPIDKGLDKIVAWLGKMLAKAKGKITEWWKKRKSFKVNNESHEIFFKGEKGAAKLWVASNPKLIEEFISSKDIDKKNPLINNAFLRITDALKAINAETKENKDNQDANLVTSLFNTIGDQLPILMSPNDWGSKENPVLLNYPKPRLSVYAPIYLGPHSKEWLPQHSVLQVVATDPKANSKTANELFGKAVTETEWNAVGKKVRKFVPTDKQPLPHEEATLGIDSDKQVQVGFRFQYTPSKTKGGRKINKLLVLYGFSPKKDGLDGDHVVEIQLIGLDKGDYLGNLWPLKQSDNRHGLSLAEQDVELPIISQGKKKLSSAAAEKSELWIMVKSTK
jgi:hypothetical protein